ncbi:MAG TPA: DUF1778 domain-containing protein, partial [Lacisediminihabitans sp.]|uniref:type II toxin-antitoxin system TacA family antitoxin n=1 Tax=Lacisediminihabitans sp. TaxID=2787631 RepID=UPI002ED92812
MTASPLSPGTMSTSASRNRTSRPTTSSAGSWLLCGRRIRNPKGVGPLYGRLPYNRAMSMATKNTRIELRLTGEQKSEIEQAAALSGRSVTDFS